MWRSAVSEEYLVIVAQLLLMSFALKPSSSRLSTFACRRLIGVSIARSVSARQTDPF